MDKNQATIDWLITCPQIQNSPLYFNFISAKDDNKQIITLANDKAIYSRYIDGSVLKRYTFTVIDFKSIAYRAIVKQDGYSDENVEDMMDVQSIIDWIDTQADIHNYPDFGQNCIIQDIHTTTENPDLNGVDTSLTPALAKYSFTIQIDYLDNSKVIWNR